MRGMNVGKGSSYIQRKLTGNREEVYKKENDVRLYDVRLYDINLFDEYQIKCCLSWVLIIDNVENRNKKPLSFRTISWHKLNRNFPLSCATHYWRPLRPLLVNRVKWIMNLTIFTFIFPSLSIFFYPLKCQWFFTWHKHPFPEKETFVTYDLQFSSGKKWNVIKAYWLTLLHFCIMIDSGGVYSQRQSRFERATQ